ncbi:probable arabinosyltransferase ARAD1 isoform X2 [Cynara cardunculus var. scolymus]|uniref:probable arabinosyltransferase ARAD1 isoform X2 n=1 Tax=Cynara cardunculus var. scolymus TaxID=59895 RepID=UPI000D626600|nr:probable arabinosyltransferase ARAD1 isoform X2 [Cynara cardunculus var. scolymus]
MFTLEETFQILAEKMIGKAVGSLVIFLITVFITYSITTGGFGSGRLGTVDLKSQLSFFSLPKNDTPLPCRSGSPLRVFMYDLPKRFNVAMMSSKFAGDDSSPLNSRNLPVWPHYAGLHRQHSVEYWMMASLLYENATVDESSEAVRVSNPEVADVFFVPFFSSLSFNTHGKNMTDPDTEFDRQLQVDILKFLRKSSYWQRTSGRDHVIPMHHPNAFRFLREEEGKVRAKLQKVLKGYEDVRFEAGYANGEGINASTHGMQSSKFCLHPAGDTPSSNRLFDAIVSHCVPVIVSDHIELPYEAELDYTKFSLFFSVQEALVPGYMVEQLRKIPEKTWIQMWKRLKEIAHHFEYQYPPKKDDAVNMLWRQVRTKVPAERLAVNRNRRLRVPDWW